MEEACKSLKLVRFFIFSPLSFSSRRFFFVGRFCPTDFTDIHRFSMDSLVNLFVHSQGVSATTGQVASAKIRE